MSRKTHLAETAFADHAEEIEVCEADNILMTDALFTDTTDTVVLVPVVLTRPLLMPQTLLTFAP